MKIHPLLTVTAASLISCGVGVALGYKIAEQKLAQHYDERLRDEIAASTEYFEHTSRHAKRYSTPEEAAAVLIKPGTILKEEAHSPLPAEESPERIAYHKIAGAYVGTEEEEGPDDRDVLPIMFPEAANPTSEQNIHTSVPYLIDQETFLRNDGEWQQSTLTWYVVDGVLADDRDKMIEDVDETVGKTNLLLFGQGSSDSNIVHIRNPRLNLEFEVLRDEGSYREKVLGIEEEPPQRPSGRG